MSYISSSLTFHSDKITSNMEEFGDEEVIIMMDWEHPAYQAQSPDTASTSVPSAGTPAPRQPELTGRLN